MEESITVRMAQYMKQNEISTSQVAFDTGISEEKLSAEEGAVLTAQELLELSAYLGINPRKF